MVRDYAKSTGFPWQYAIAQRPILEKLNVIQTDTKYVVDRRGVIVYQGGWGAHDATLWRSVLEKMVE